MRCTRHFILIRCPGWGGYLVVLVLCALAWLGAGLGLAAGAVYYIDSGTGDDASVGTSPERAWKSLARVNEQVFLPGDQVRFRAGTRYAGQLKPQGSGVSEEGRDNPIVMGMYGEGPKPRIDGEGATLDTLLLRNVEFWDVEDLEITNLGTNRAPERTGVRVVSDGFGVMRGLHLRRLFVHDVNGDLRKDHEGCGVFFESRGGNASHFDDLRIENCHVERTDRNGICQRGGRGPRSTHVVIRGNLLEDIGGDGIKLWGSDGGLIESNVLRGGRMRCADYAAGIWPFDCDDTLIQFNEVSGMKGTLDGQGFDSDYLCRRSVFQYNYSHDNDGGFMLICGPGNSHNEDTVIRYNISQNDGLGGSSIFHFAGKSTDARIYNNTIYVGRDQHLPMLLFTTWDRGDANGAKFWNNIFYVDGQTGYEWGRSTNIVFESNVFFGGIAEPAGDPEGLTNRPPLLAPGNGTAGFASLRGYECRAGVEGPRGRMVADNGGRDFFERTVPRDRAPSIGACEAAP